jgi:alpha-amylase/alpha-mannosidase (GH57 family)
MIWSNFLHIYQPPEQNKDIVNRITFESYWPIINVLKNNPKARLTLNINACLTEQLIQHGHGDLVTDIKNLIEKGRLELTESAKYHAFLALLPEEEILRQITLNKKTHQEIFGEKYAPKGFFIPEMAYSRKVADIVADIGYKWIIISEISLGGKQNSNINASQTYHLKGNPDFKVFFRSQRISDLIHRQGIKNAANFFSEAKKKTGGNGYFITAMDGEVYGHHRSGYEKFLRQLYANKSIEFLTISKIAEKYPISAEIEPVSASWSALEEDLSANIPYSLWNHPDNPVHKKQWELTNLVMNVINECKNDLEFKSARAKLDAALFSCQYWWASSIPWWKLEMIEMGASMLKSTISLLEQPPAGSKEKAESLYNEIMAAAFNWENSSKARANAEYYTKKISQELGEYVP